MTVFTSYFQWTKLDLSFLNFRRFKFLGWNKSSEKMMKAQLYWQSTFHNYFILILILTIIIIAVVNINKYSNQSIILQKLKMLLALAWFDKVSFFIFIFLNTSQFFVANIIRDIVNFRSQIIFSSISTCLWILLVTVLLISKWKLLRLEFLNKMDPANNAVYFYLSIIRNFILAIMFAFEWSMLSYSLLLVAVLISQFLLTLVHTNDKSSTSEILKERLLIRITNAHLLIVMLLIWTMNMFPTENCKKLWAFVITEFFICLLAISIILKFIKINN